MMTTKKNEDQFNNPAVNAMFATKQDQTPESKKTPKQGDAVKSNTGAKLNNHSAEQTNTTVETRSQRRQLLLTEELNRNMKLLAMVKGISVNEMINDTMNRYVESEMKNPEVKNMMAQLAKMHRHN